MIEEGRERGGRVREGEGRGHWLTAHLEVPAEGGGSCATPSGI